MERTERMLQAFFVSFLIVSVFFTMLLSIHREDSEKTLSFLSETYRSEINQTFQAIREGYLNWTPMLQAVDTEDWTFVRSYFDELQEILSARAMVIGREGRILRTFPGDFSAKTLKELFRKFGEDGKLHGLLREEHFYAIRSYPILKDDKKEDLGYRALVVIDNGRALRSFRDHARTQIKITPSSNGENTIIEGFELSDISILNDFDRHPEILFFLLGTFLSFFALWWLLLEHMALKSRNSSSMLALSSLLEQRDPYTAGHSERVRDCAVRIAGQMELRRREILRISRAAMVHDLGKVLTPDSILQKKGPLTEEEFNAIRRHPVDGAEIARRLLDDEEIVAMVRYHHERWAGGGYPDGLAGKEIPLGARILTVADVVDAMMTNRPYRKGLSRNVVINHLEGECGKLFDPVVVRAALKTLPRLQEGNVPPIEEMDLEATAQKALNLHEAD